jgi:5-methylcytosine-specific restriction endonuclease McrA
VARQGNTTQLGMGYAYQQDRKRAITAMPDGTPCPLCGRPMHRDRARNHDGRSLHYDHIIPRALGGHDGPKRLTCATCNIKAGATLGNQLRRRKPRRRRTTYTRW